MRLPRVAVCNAVFLRGTSSTALEHDLEETPDNGSQTSYFISTSRGSLEQHKPVDGNGGEELAQHGAGSLTLEVLKMDDGEVAGRIGRGDRGGRVLVPNGEEDLAAGGVGAILSTPNVKTVLFLGCAIQVRQVSTREDALYGNLSVYHSYGGDWPQHSSQALSFVGRRLPGVFVRQALLMRLFCVFSTPSNTITFEGCYASNRLQNR